MEEHMNQISVYHLQGNIQGNSPEPVQEKQAFGHRFKVVKEKLRLFFVEFFHAIGRAFSERSPLGKILKFSINVLTGIGHAAGPAFRGAGLLHALKTCDAYNDCLDIAMDVDHFVNAGFKKDGINKWSLTASVGFFAADVAGLALWLDELAFINLAQISAKIGNGVSKLTSVLRPALTKVNTVIKACPFLAQVAVKITLLNVIRGVVAGAFLALAINESRKLVNAIREKNIQEIVNCSLYLASFVAEIALKVLVIVGMTNVPGLVVVGCLAAGFGLSAFFMEVIRKYREEKAKDEALLAAQNLQVA